MCAGVDFSTSFAQITWFNACPILNLVEGRVFIKKGEEFFMKNGIQILGPLF